jgi:hypothetical protein
MIRRTPPQVVDGGSRVSKIFCSAQPIFDAYALVRGRPLFGFSVVAAD